MFEQFLPRSLWLIFSANQQRFPQVSMQGLSPGFYFWTGLWCHLIGEEPVNPARKITSTATRFEAKSAKQRERRIDVMTGENQGRFAFQI